MNNLRHRAGILALALAAVNAIGCVPPPIQGPATEAPWTVYKGNLARSTSDREPLVTSPTPYWNTGTGRGAAAAMAVGDSVIAIQDTGKRLTLLWKETGERVWRTHLRGNGAAGPLLDEELVFAGTGGDDGRVYAYLIETGKKKWDNKFAYLAGPIALGDSTVFGASERGAVRSIFRDDGRTAWEIFLGSRILSGVTALDGRLIVATRDSLFSLDAGDGSVIGSAVLPAPLASPPAFSGEILVYSSPAGAVIGLDRDGMEESWRVDLEEPSFGGAVIARDTVFATTVSGHIWRIPLDDPGSAANWDLDVAVRAPVAPIANGVMVGTLAGEVLRLSGGPEPEWSVRVDGPITVAPVINDGILFVIDGRGRVHTWH